MKSALIAAALFLIALLPLRGFADSDWNTSVSYTSGFPLTSGEPITYGAFYGRLLRLQYSGSANGRLLATYQCYNNFVIYQSNDDGLTWTSISAVSETHLPAPWVFSGEPHLYELPRAVGGLPAGTVMIAGSSVRTNPVGGSLEQQNELYYSLDHGVTWAYRGTADSTDGTNGGIWEPNLQVSASGKLVMYYSDERFMPTYNQILGERVSTDGGQTWGAEQKVVAIPDGVQRPGMAVTQRLPSGLYVMSYEWVNPTGPNPARIRFSSDGINWGSPTDWGTAVTTASGAFLGATPYVVWIPFGGPDGTLIVNGRSLRGTPNTDREIFVNYNLGVGPWHALPSPVQWQGGENFDGWSMGMIPTADGRGIIQIAPTNMGGNTNEILIGREPILSPGLNYEFTNEHSALTLSAPANSFTHGTYLQQLASGAGVGQAWTFTDLGNEDFLVVNPFNGLCADDYAWATTDGSPIDQWDQNGLVVQQWFPMPVGDGSFKFLNVNSGKLMSVLGQSTSSGAGVVIRTNDGGIDQNWVLSASTYPSSAGLAVSSSSVTGGNSVTGVVSLASEAPSAGTKVTLHSSSSSVAVPASVTIPAGAHEASFSVSTKAVAAATTATLTATAGTSSSTTTISVTTPAVTSLALSPSTLLGGASATGKVTLTGKAPVGGWVVKLTSQNSSVTVPASVTVSAGETTGSFSILTPVSKSTYTVKITATGSTGSAVASLTVLGDSLAKLVISPNSVTGGKSATGTVTLSASAPTGGWTVTLVSSNSNAHVPATVKIAAGSTTGTFQITTKATAASVKVTVTASDALSKQSASLTLLP